MPTLQDLLSMKIDAENPLNGEPIQLTPDFRVAVQGERDGGVHFIIHPNGHNGDTLDFVAKGDKLTRLWGGDRNG